MRASELLMCNTVHLDGRTYAPRALASIVGGIDHLIWREQNPFVNLPDGLNWQYPDLCLCAIDIDATVSAARFRLTLGGSDPMEMLLERVLS